ncbi:nuclear transport factor 2 family protein [Chitinophaga sp. Mgbs1]|uniref:Nuclear transport factor 2 family protein n=1 Tax=Chitinophaga solisilvae TaxID=1233460 RepID=A0A3S1AVI7_9BACT|nr:nuclear transport factor 2 family protein [Chitinophaga solisilvae]
MKAIIPALSCIMTLFSIAGKAQSSSGTLEEAKKAIALCNAQHFALFAKNDGSILSLYTEDACLLMPGSPMRCGREGLLKFFNDAYAAGSRSGNITTLRIYGDGQEYVTEEGLTQVFDGNGKMMGAGKYIVSFHYFII